MYELLSQIISATAWEMEPIRPYGPFHLSFALVGFTLCACFAWQLRGLDEKGNQRLLMGLGIFLLVCEVYKQLFYYFHINGGSYAWHAFPFQLCSIPMYLCVLAPVVKSRRLQRTMYTFMMSFNLLGGFITFFEPSGIITKYWTITLHSHIWHMLLVFIGLYLGFSRRGGREDTDFFDAAKLFFLLCAIAFLLNTTVIRLLGEDINMFFVGPQNSPIVVFKQISETFGWYVGAALYIPAVCLGAYLVFLPFRLSDNWILAKKQAFNHA